MIIKNIEGEIDMNVLGIGLDDFKVLIEKDCYYIDKTNLINEIIKSPI